MPPPPIHAFGPLPPRDDAAACAAEVAALLRGYTDEAEERRVLDVLERCPGPVLNDVLGRLDLNRLTHALVDHGGTRNHRTQLYDMLTVRRVDELTVASRAGLVDGLQRDRTRRLEERAICNLFLATHGEQLTELKNRVDAGGDDQDLAEVVFQDVDDVWMRADVLDHIAREAQGVAGGLKVVSDIDDTFYCSLNDRRYPAGTVYPGVRQLYHELDRADGRAGDLTFISARPDAPPGVGENATHRFLRRHGVEEAVILSGPTGGLVDHESMAVGKHENLQRYRALYPEYDAVLLGDSGQGDIRFAEKAIRSEGDAIAGAFIHDVVGTPRAERDRLRGRGIVLCDTYVDAAVEAYQKGLLSRDAVERVALAAVIEMDAIAFDTPEQRDARRSELLRALDRVADLERP